MEVKNISLTKVYPSPMNPRKTFDEKELEELADNIGKQGLLQPITVRPKINHSEDARFDFPDKYEIVCGERRYRAFVLLHDNGLQNGSYVKFKEIPSIVREMNDDEAFEAMITENLQRKDVDPIEEGFAFSQLLKKGKPIEEIAAKFGKSVRFIQDRIRLNSLIPELKESVRSGKMAITAAQVICRLPKEDQNNFNKNFSSCDNITKNMAESHVANKFLAISNSPWYKADRPNYTGNCGLKCSECHANTAVQGCLFSDLNDKKEGRCTDRQQYFSKCLSFIASEITGCDYDLVKKGQPLEKGKAVLYVNEEWCSEDTRKLKERFKENFSDYEIASSVNGPFSYCYSTKLDDETRELLQNGAVYPCLKIFSYDDINPHIEYYTLKDSSRISKAKDPVEALLDERENIIGRIEGNEVDLIKEIAKDVDLNGMTGELTDTEKRALGYILFTKINRELVEAYGHDNVYGEEMAKTAKSHLEDINQWFRKYILSEIHNIYITGLKIDAAKEVLPLWTNCYHAQMAKLKDEHEAKLRENAEKLEKLGYDINGNPIEKKAVK